MGFDTATRQDRDDLAVVHGRNEAAARKSLEGMMRPELINRFDDIVVFHALSRREVSKIFDLQVADLQKRLSRKGIGLVVTSKAKKVLMDKGYNAHHGVRPLRRVLQNDIEHPIAEGLIAGKYEKEMCIRDRCYCVICMSTSMSYWPISKTISVDSTLMVRLLKARPMSRRSVVASQPSVNLALT